MIERLVIGLRRLASASPAELETDEGMQLRGDCADAVRLELDCPQQSLTLTQRSALARLSDALEEDGTPSGEVIAAARAAFTELGEPSTR